MVTRVKGLLWETVIIIAGTFLMAVGVNVIYEPLHMVTGGVSGLAIVIKSWTQNWIPGGVPIWLTNALCNIPLFLIALKLKGKRFIGRTLLATISFTVGLGVIPIVPIVDRDYLMAALCGGALSGAGLGLVFTTSASTGGTDLLGTILNHWFRNVRIPAILFVVDSVIVLIGAAEYGLHNTLYAVVAAYLAARVMDGILEGLKFARQAFIISSRSDEIAKEIMRTLDRGVTAIHSRGMYQRKEKDMLMCIISKREIVKLRDLVGEMDPNAFLIFSDVREVMGEGFIEYRQ